MTKDGAYLNLNEYKVGGRVGKVNVRYTKDEKPVLSFSVATSEKGADGEYVTEWHEIVAFGKVAEWNVDKVAQGCLVYVEGMKQTNVWKNKEGQEIKSAYLKAFKIQCVTQKEGKQERGEKKPQGKSYNPQDDDALDNVPM